MLVLSRHHNESLAIGPGPGFPAALVEYLQRVALLPADDESRRIAEEIIKTTATATPLFNQRVTVVDIRGDKVRLGCDAAPAVAIHRHEVAERIRIEGEARLLTVGE